MIINCKNKTFDFTIDAPPSKSLYHRELIVRFLCGDYSHLNILDTDSNDIRETKTVLQCLYNILKHSSYSLSSSKPEDNLSLETASNASQENSQENSNENSNENTNEEMDDSEKKNLTFFPCGESGSTLRLLIPVISALLLGEGRNKYGLDGFTIGTQGRLFDRPIKALRDAMRPHGIIIEKIPETRSIMVTGTMTPGDYKIDGRVSSQYISGLLMALTVFDEPCSVEVTGELKSVHYVELTQDVLAKYGCPATNEGNIYHPSAGGYSKAQSEKSTAESILNSTFKVEGDWSNGAFLLCMQRWSDIKVNNLNPDSKQGDKAILEYLELVDYVMNGKQADYKCKPDSFIFVDSKNNKIKNIYCDCTDIPDITPYMAVIAPFVFDKITFSGIDRLRIKESDRVKAVTTHLSNIGVRTVETDDELIVYRFTPGEDIKDKKIYLPAFNDHRMVMCAILLAVILKCEVDIDNIYCIRKSFPEFLGYIDRYF